MPFTECGMFDNSGINMVLCMECDYDSALKLLAHKIILFNLF